MKRWKLYFAYAHLPPHLQAVSRPFHDLAVIIEAGAPAVPRGQFVALREMLSGLLVVDHDEMRCAQQKLNECWVEMFDDEEVGTALRLLLEAKDAAVRAHIPDPPGPDAG